MRTVCLARSRSIPSLRHLLAYIKSLPCGKRLLSCLSIPKKSRPASPNNFRPVALTSHVIKSFEKNHQNHDHDQYTLSIRSPAICISAWERGGGCTLSS